MPEKKNRLIAGVLVATACVVTLATMGRATIFLVVAMVVCYVLWLRRLEWPPAKSIVGIYGLALLVQCAQTLEEYRAGFHRAFPAVFGVGPWSDRRFLIFNFVWLTVFLLAGFGLARQKREAYLVVTFLAIGGGILNGLGHLALSAREGGYFPGAYTGILALLVGSLLTYRLMLGQVHVRP